MFDLTGKVALVTGASSGLGRGFAATLATHGARVAATARRVDRLEDLADEIRALDGVCVPIPMDVTSTESVREAFDAAEALLGPVDIVINNAGVPSGGFATKLTDDDWRSVLAVNLDGVFRVAREAAQRMQARGQGGAIVNVASILGLGVLKGLAPYATSKAAVIQLTKALALELARDRIRVNALAPGYVATEMNAEFLASDAGRKLLAKIPFARAGASHELDGALLLLASDAGSYITGTAIVVDGGSLLSLG